MTDSEPRPARSVTPRGSAFTAAIGDGWAPRSRVDVARHPAADAAAARRARLAALYPGVTLVIPAGSAKVRSNDTDYPYRAHSAFAHLTAWAPDAVPGAVLLITTAADGTPASTVYFRPPAGRNTDEFYADSSVGEFWIGRRPDLGDVAAALGVATADLRELDAALDSAARSGEVVVIREADREVTALVDTARGSAPGVDADSVLARDASELRLVKDEWEVAEMRAAIAATADGFDDILTALPAAVAHPRGERIVEGAFFGRARADGNDVGYGTIAASGSHACILHWTRNDGAVRDGDLLLVDAGVERDSYYTADITRTVPVSGTFSPTQREIYQAVLDAADAAFAVVRPGIRFREVHAAAMAVIAERTASWGLLPVSAEEALRPEAGHHRRYMVHGTSHHLGIDVHDCNAARADHYMDGELRPGMIFTIEPGLYFQADDLTVPEHFRGIGVRIEDDILVTESGAENLSLAIPRTVADVEAWVQRQRA